MKTKRTWTTILRATALSIALFCCAGTSAAEEQDELFDLNNIIVQGELYLWNRISDIFDLFRVGVAGGADIGFDIAVTKYAQLGAMVTKERGVDFPHFIPPFWMFHYYQQKKIFNTHEGYCATAAIGPYRFEKSDKDEGAASFLRHDWDLRAEAAAIGHIYVDFSAKETADFIVGFVGWDYANDDQKLDPSARRKPADQFSRGICNILFGAIEIPANIIRVTDEEGDMAGAAKGLGLGVWRFLCREIVGVVEFVSFPFGWEPIIEPEYLIQKTQNAVWNVKRPTFHKRY